MAEVDFEEIVSRHYEPLYRFALSLTRTETDACDLTQQTFYVWAAKGHQLRDAGKVKSWLFTTLHREFLNTRRQAARLQLLDVEEIEQELPSVPPEMISSLDTARVLEFLQQVKEPYRAALTLFYLEDYSYKEITEILDVPIGTIQSRISRGMAQLTRLILVDEGAAPRSCLPLVAVAAK
ncbi:MAG TPA: RNA polymerase sigma factor [Verrucomicrobiae bacterium]|nr:RNA polymerase sigma factor [Verrucomicrobiae bacterium]